jgi:hypothetical protein
MVFRIAVNSNPSGSNGAQPKEFRSRRGSGQRPKSRTAEANPFAVS